MKKRLLVYGALGLVSASSLFGAWFYTNEQSKAQASLVQQSEEQLNSTQPTEATQAEVTPEPVVEQSQPPTQPIEEPVPVTTPTARESSAEKLRSRWNAETNNMAVVMKCMDSLFDQMRADNTGFMGWDSYSQAMKVTNYITGLNAYMPCHTQSTGVPKLYFYLKNAYCAKGPDGVTAQPLSCDWN